MTYHAIEDGQKPRLGCCNKLQKFSVWIINFVLFVVGLAQIAAGVWAWKSDASDWTGTSIPKACIGFGLILIFISFLGCCGAWKENRPLLWLYAFLVFSLILGQVGALSIAAVSKDYTMRFMQEVWEHMGDKAQTEIEDAYKCCSFMGSDDLNHWSPIKDDNYAYGNCTKTHEDDGWKKPIPTCYEQAHDDVESNLKTVLIAIAIVGTVQILILFMTMCLISGISGKVGAKKEQKKQEYEVVGGGTHYPEI